jgi:hypothetical protein
VGGRVSNNFSTLLVKFLVSGSIASVEKILGFGVLLSVIGSPLRKIAVEKKGALPFRPYQGPYQVGHDTSGELKKLGRRHELQNTLKVKKAQPSTIIRGTSLPSGPR